MRRSFFTHVYVVFLSSRYLIKSFLIFYSSILFVFQSVLGKDGAVMGVTVTRMSMALHSQTLTQACDYSEGN